MADRAEERDLGSIAQVKADPHIAGQYRLNGTIIAGASSKEDALRLYEESLSMVGEE